MNPKPLSLCYCIILENKCFKVVLWVYYDGGSGERSVGNTVSCEAVKLKNKKNYIYTAWTKNARKQSERNWKIAFTIGDSFFLFH